MQNFDIFPYQPSLNVNETNGYKTGLGGILSILLSLCSLLSIGYFGKDLVFKLNPISSVSELYDSDPLLEYDKIHLSLGLGAAGGVPIPELESYVSFYFGYIDLDNTRTTPAQYGLFPAVKCVDYNEDYKNNTNNLKSFLQGVSSGYYCPPPNFNYNLIGKYGRGRFLAWNIYVRFCNNATSPIPCKSKEQTRKVLAQAFMGMVVTNNLINPLNFTDPVTHTYQSYIMRVSAFASRQDTLFFSKVKFKSDEGFLFESYKDKDSFVIDKKESDTIAEESPEFLFRLLVTLNNNYSEIRRVYQKIQKVAADVGGIVKFLLIIFSYTNYMFSKIQFLRYIKSRVKKHDEEIGNLIFKFGLSHLDIHKQSLKPEESNSKPISLNSPNKNISPKKNDEILNKDINKISLICVNNNKLTQENNIIECKKYSKTGVFNELLEYSSMDENDQNFELKDEIYKLNQINGEQFKEKKSSTINNINPDSGLVNNFVHSNSQVRFKTLGSLKPNVMGTNEDSSKNDLKIKYDNFRLKHGSVGTVTKNNIVLKEMDKSKLYQN